MFPPGIPPFPFPHIVGQCEPRSCPGRLTAMLAGEFIYRHEQPKGWIFVEGSVREWLGNARWSPEAYGAVDHAGECFTWSTCPWCGRELPG